MMPRHKNKVLIMALLAATCLAHPGTALAQLKSANSATTVTTAPNGVPVVNIANPNSSGLSDNKFTDYNVGASGLVLNNGDSSQSQRQSQLGGAISANQNLSHSASIILNEVVSANRSELDGYTEVLGASADVVVANPNGITCSGCGFINTPHATLTTGNPVINSGGALTGFNVSQGDILITGQGLDASRPDYLGLFARSLSIAGQINAKQLDVVAGANSIDYATKAVTAQSAAGTVPTLAIDSSALGGMYANRIRLIATEAGVGVRVLGDAAAGTGDFTLNGAGKIQIGSHVSAAGNIQVTTVDNSVADSIKLTDATLGSGADTTLVATNGNIHLVGGLLASQGSLTLQSATLTDTSDTNTLANNNKRYASGNLTLTQTGAATLDGTSLGAVGALSIAADTLSVGADGETLFGNSLTAITAGDITLAGAQLKSIGNLSLTSTAGQITTTSGAGEGIESTTGNILLKASTGVDNAGAISADLGNFTIDSDNSIVNSGTMYAKLVGTLSDKAGDTFPGGSTPENIDNYGTLLADGGLSISGSTLTNHAGAGIQGTTGSTYNLFMLDNYGTIIGSANAANSASIVTSRFTNESTGIFQSAKDMGLNVAVDLSNYGKILATGNMTVANPGFLSLTVNNYSGGVMQAGGTLSITQSGVGVTMGTQSGYLIGNAINLNIPNLFNSGVIQGGSGASTITIQSTLQNNAGGVLTLSTASGGSGTVSAADLTNSGVLQSTGNLTVNVSNALTNNSNSVIQSGGNATLNITNTLTNSYYILAGGNLTIDARNSGSTLAIANGSAGIMQAGGTLGIAGTSGGNNVTIGGTTSATRQSGSLLGNALNFNVSSLINDGSIQGGASTITVQNNLENDSGALLYLSTGSSDSSTASALNLINNGTIQSNGNLTLSGDLTNSRNSTHQANDGIIQSSHNLTLNATNSLSNNYYILASGNLSIAALSSGTTLDILNSSGGIIQAGGTLGISGTSGGSNVEIGYMQSGSQVNVQSGYLIGNALNFNLSSLINGGTIQGNSINTNNVITVSGTLINNAGGLINSLAGGAHTDVISAATVTNNGTLQASSNITIDASGTLTNGGTGIIQSQFSNVILNVGQTLANSHQIYAYGDVDITAADNVNTLAVTNNGTGTIESNSTSISVNGYSGGNNVTFNNVAGGVLFGDLGFNVSSLTNAGTIQGAAFNSIAATTLTNTGTLSLSNSTTGSGTISATNFTNNGTLQSDGGLTINLGTNTLTEGAGNKIIAGGNLNLTAGTISFGSSSSAIISNKTQSGTGTITLSGKLNNSGVLFSGDGLNITATQVANNATGGIAALGTLNLTGTLGDVPVTCAGVGIWGSVINCGSLYAGSALNVYADAVGSPRVYYNGTFYNQTGATVNSSGNIFINAGGSNSSAFDNYSSINATGTITINVGSLQNTVTSGFFINEAAGNIHAGSEVLIENFYNANNYGHINAPTVELASGIFGRNNLLTFTNRAGGFILAGSLISGSGSDCPNEFINTAAGESCTGGGFTLTNSGSTGASTGATVTTTSNGSNLAGDTTGTTGTQAGSATGSSTSLIGGASTTNHSPASSTQNAAGANAITLNGVTITLPTNPNGFFIINPNPGFGPLIETNPLYQVGSSFLGADYMIKTYGVDPDTLVRQLGDANYQAYLIQQQVDAAHADAILGTGIENQAAAMQQLMDNGVTVGKSLGLTIGVAPTAAQIASLSTNMVWMVDTVVDGQHTLAPVVYLSAATKSQISAGGVIVATNINMSLESLNNSGTIQVSDNMNVTTHGNFNNNSGAITATNINLVSTGGDIINQTSAHTIGDPGNQMTLIGPTGTITATGNLSLNAANNITNLGANMTAGGNANLVAGRDITFGTIQDITSTTSTSHSGNIFSGSDTTTVNTTVRNIGSNLTVGGNLTSNSGQNTNIIGSNVNVAGNGSMTTGGNLNIVDAQDLNSSASVTTTSGLGVGGGVYGAERVTDTDVKGTSVASNVNFGGNASLNSTGDVTLQGSNANANGNLNINAANVNVLAGQNTDVHTRTVDTTTLLSISGGNSTSGNSGANTNYTQTQQQNNMGQNNTGAGANASAGETATGEGLNLVNRTITTTTDNTITAVGSKLTSGGNLSVNSTGNTTLVGATVGAGGAVDLNAGGNLNVLAAQNVHTTSTTTDSTGLGLYASSTNNATSGANAGYGNTSTGGANTNGANQLVGSSGNYTGSATAGGDASSNNTLNLFQYDQSSKITTDITHTGTTITSGGNTTLGAKNDINVAGSKVNATGNLSLDAGANLNVTDVQDSHVVTTTDSLTTAGLYANGDANASASGTAIDGSKYGGADTQANGTASANANAGVGIQASNTTSSSSTGSTRAVVSSLTSGGDMTRTAGGTITDVGTKIDAGGNFTQTAASWVNNAAQDTTFSTTSSDTNTAQLGVYAGAGASRSGNYDQQLTQTGKDPEASVGVSANYLQNTSGSTSATSNAVVSNIKAGSFTSTTTGSTSLEGTNITTTGAGDLTLNAASLDYTAAQNTTSNTNSSGQINVGLKAGEGTSGYTGDLSGGANTLGTTSSSSTAVVGGLNAGGNLTVNTSGNQTYEGTNLKAGNSATIQSTAGDVTFNAAQDTTSNSKNYQGFTADISGNEKGGGATFDGGTNSQSSSSSTAVVSNVTAGNGGLTIKANNDLTLQGTNLNSGGDVTLGANTLNYEAAQNTSSSSQATQTLNASVSGASDGSKGGAAGSYVNNNTSNSSTTAVVGSINAAGNLKVTTTGDQTYTGTNITAGGNADVTSNSGAVNFNQAQNTTSSSSTQWGVSGSASTSQGDDGGTTQQGALGGGYQTNSSATTTGIASNIRTGGNLNVTSNNDLTLQGTNIASGGDATLQSNNGSVNYQATTSTATGSGWGVNAGISGSDSSSGTGGTSKGGQVGGNYSTQNDVTQSAGSITSGGKVTVTGNQNVNLVGTNISSTGATSLTATNGSVDIGTTTSTQNDQSYAASLSGKTTSGSSVAANNKNDYGGSVDVNVKDNSTQTGATINAGSFSITSGKDTTMTGTNVTSAGDTNINAGGNINLAAAESTYGGVDLNATYIQSKNVTNPLGGLIGKNSYTTGGIPLVQSAGVSGGVNNQGVNITTGGSLNTNSGGSTTMQATQVDANGTVTNTAGGGVTNTSTVSGGVDVGFKLGLNTTGSDTVDAPSQSSTQINAKGNFVGANLSVQQTSAIFKGVTTAVASAPPALQQSFISILNNPNLSQADKFKQMTTAINNDPALSAADKTSMLAALAKQQQSLSGQ